jgi:hypothetical protein
MLTIYFVTPPQFFAIVTRHTRLFEFSPHTRILRRLPRAQQRCSLAIFLNIFAIDIYTLNKILPYFFHYFQTFSRAATIYFSTM